MPDGAEESAERAYAQHADILHRKKLGQFFTPPRVAAMMADWVAGADPQLVLEPALGTGVLARAMLARCPDVRVIAYERDSRVLDHADVAEPHRVEIHHADFLPSKLSVFDGVIANPPYIRHRELENAEAARAEISVSCGYIIPRSANLYIYFVSKCLMTLRSGGRGAFLIPTEWMNANFSANFKRMLIEGDWLRHVVLFSGCSNIFEDALTTASVLLVERK